MSLTDVIKYAELIQKLLGVVANLIPGGLVGDAILSGVVNFLTTMGMSQEELQAKYDQAIQNIETTADVPETLEKS